MHSGEVLSTKEHKITISKDKTDRYIDIDDLKIFKDFSASDKTTYKTKIKIRIKTKTETKDKNNVRTKEIPDKISNKMNIINKLFDKIDKIGIEVTEKIEWIYESVHELQNWKYDDESWLKPVELEKIDAITDETLNALLEKICKGNKISPEKIMIGKHKDIDEYVSKLTDVMNNKIEWMNRIGREIDIDTLQSIDDKLTEILKKSIKNLKKIVT